MTGAIKNDVDKPRYDLLPMDAVEEIVKVLTKGAEKYAPDNWRADGGFEWHRLIRAAYGHLAAFHRGEDNDPEWGLSHLAHLGCCVLFLLHYQKYHKAYPKDDRYRMNMPSPAQYGEHKLLDGRCVVCGCPRWVIETGMNECKERTNA